MGIERETGRSRSRSRAADTRAPHGIQHPPPTQPRCRDRTRRDGIPLTAPAQTLLDLATRLPRRRLEAAINAADKLDLIDPEALRADLQARRHEPGLPALRRLLDARTFVLTDSELERRFLPIARRAGLPKPRTGERIRGYKVDFHWPELGLIVETDGLRYHRTPAQQAKDRRRDQVLTTAGLTVLRFTHAQVTREPGEVARILGAVAARAGLRR